MAKVTITIEDMPENKVRVISTPSAETLLQKIASHGPESLTSSEAYTLFVLRQLREESKNQRSTNIIVPRIGRA